MQSLIIANHAATQAVDHCHSSRLRIVSELQFPWLPTADGSGQTVHPSVVYFPEKWNGYAYWMAVSGYKNGIAAYENTHIFVSNDLLEWTAPPNFTNPIDTAVIGDFQSDPNLLFKDGVLYLYYRDGNTLLRRMTTDGSNWAPREFCTSDETVVSPSVHYFSGQWHMWAGKQDEGGGLYRYQSNDGVHWGDGRRCRTSTRPNLTIWHCDVWRDGALYHTVASAGTGGYSTLNTTQLYYGSSIDGENWYIDELPCVPKGIDQRLVWRIYKSCVVPHGGKQLLLVSGGDKPGGTQLSAACWTEMSAFPKPDFPPIDERWIDDYGTMDAGERKDYGWFKPSPYQRLRGIVKLEHGGTLVVRQGADPAPGYTSVQTVELDAAKETEIDIALSFPWVNVSLQHAGSIAGYVRNFISLLR